MARSTTMDGDPLVPKETTQCQKIVTWLGVASIAIFLLVVLIITVIEGSSNGHSGNYVVALGLGTLVATFVLVYRWLPHDSLEPKVHYALYAQALVFVILAAGVLMMAYNTTACAVCPKCPDCPRNDCTLKGVTPDTWFQMPACFEALAAKNWIAVSQDQTCPPKKMKLF